MMAIEQITRNAFQLSTHQN